MEESSSIWYFSIKVDEGENKMFFIFSILLLCFNLNTQIYEKGDIKIQEIYDEITKDQEGRKILKRKIYYSKEGLILKEERYSRLSGVLKEIVFYNNGKKCAIESYYASDRSIKGKREFLKSREYLYEDCKCEEFYNGSKEIQYNKYYGQNCPEFQNKENPATKHCVEVSGCLVNTIK